MSNTVKLIEEALEEALAGRHEDAPFPLDEKEAELWHRAQAEAFQYCLEMMG
jgi:hypothetical protein